MVAGELSDLAGEADAAIGEQDLGLADAAGVEEDLARRRIARGILIAEAEVEIAELDPAQPRRSIALGSGAPGTGACS